MNITTPKVAIQIDSADSELRTDLWNYAYEAFFSAASSFRFITDMVRSENGTLIKSIWKDYFKKEIDLLRRDVLAEYVIATIKNEFLNQDWYKLYNLLQFISDKYFINTSQENFFYLVCNDIFEKNLSAYRFIDKLIVPISSIEEKASIEEALTIATVVNPVKIHLKRALEFFSDRENPDYRNSIKESISAVESCCKFISGDDKATLGKALAILAKKHKLDIKLKSAFSILYDYTSDAEGIRHALMDTPTLSQEDAKYMLVICSAFINYLMVKNSR